ncbi:MAG TPA: penicillin-binding protein 2 [Solirubrobacteraceae bacterium]
MASVQRRAGLIFAALFVLLALAAIRTLYLGTVHSGTLRQDASEEHETLEAVPAPRGTITDRDGVVLAVSEPADDISATPYLVKKPLQAAKQLAPLLDQSESEVLHELGESSTFVYLARSLPAARAKQIQALGIEGIEETPTMRRVYPRGTLAAQVLGVPGTEGQGLFGLEYSSNATLEGEEGQRHVVSDEIGQPISITDVHREVPGKAVSLTLDANIQHRAEAVLGAIGSVFHPKDATAIVANPNTGEVLAMANWPQLNANYAAEASPAQFGKLEEEGLLENRAVGFNYEPGSTFKAVTFSGALEEGLITPETTINVPDEIQVANRVIHDDEPHPEETLTASEILARSSNVGTIKIGAMLGPYKFNDWVRRYGFGSHTGIDLPGEEIGEVLTPSEYSGSSMGNLPIGQGEAVTPIQIVTAYSAIANGGILRPTHVIRSIGGKALPLPAGRRVVSAKTAAEVRKMMEGVLAPGGTASEVSVPGYQLAGKTGTANKIDPETGEYSETAYVASFVGFAPASHPKLLCAVVVDEPETGSIYGGTVAAPAFGQIMAFALPYLGIAPESGAAAEESGTTPE